MNYKNRITPENIQRLKNNEVFVFGSNLSGIHGAGAAYIANQNFGFPFHQGFGLQYNTVADSTSCFAIPTKDWKLKILPINKIQFYINEFIEFVKYTPDLLFLVTAIGTGFSKYSPEDIAPLFKECINLENVYLPESFWKILDNE